jgi:hypothetical protein
MQMKQIKSCASGVDVKQYSVQMIVKSMYEEDIVNKSGQINKR